ncbi:RHS repeat-associated core domain-containing protein [Paenibacillus faecalis]|uniref:RHS repeat-associated core domain-containing protein n=1 Tax=Paenibacillus faecalis TaxID=2079532 RepID=UPI000D0F68CC|nr:RHS repeat-associated core domain-containing protein [Paenibacillus faecalis]
MKAKWVRFISLFMTVVLLMTSVPFSIADAKENKANKKPKDQRSEIAQSFNKKESEVQSLLDEGYTAEEISLAYMNQETDSIPLDKALGNATKVPINRSKDKSRIENPASKSDVKKEVSTSGKKDSSVDSSATIDNPVNKETLNNLDIKTDSAPYSIGSSGEYVSTLDGSLSLSTTDMMLPGRNGLSFALTRSYNSSDAQYYDIKGTIYDDEDLIYSVYFKGREKIFRLKFAPKFQLVHKREYAKADGTDSEIQTIGTDEWTLDSSIKKTDADKLAVKLQNSKPSYTGPWSAVENGYKKRDIFTYVDNSVQTVAVDMVYTEESRTGEFLRHEYINEDEAKAELNLLNSLAGSTEYLFDDAEITGTDDTEYLIKLYDIDTGTPESKPARIKVEPNTDGKWVSSQTTVSTYNDTWFPLGKGWSWNIPYIKDGTYVHLAGRGTYERDGSSLKGYPWNDLSITDETGTILVNGKEQAYKYILSSIDGTKQYFNTAGHLIKITDSHGNYIDFQYAHSTDYGRELLSKISDPLGNEINIAYSKTEVVVTSGDKTVTYTKVPIQNNGNIIEILDRVTDPGNRVTRYEYSQKTNTRYNMLNDDISSGISNGYALIDTVYHPTGAETKYEYKPLPTTRYVGPDAVNQVYQIQSREDRIITLNPDTQKPTYTASNRVNFDYQGDIGSSYGSDISFSTISDDGLAKTTYQYDKDYIDATNPTTYYQTNIKQVQSGLETSINYTYDREKRLTSPIDTSTTYKDSQSGKVRTETTRTQYDSYGNVKSQTDEQGITIQYTYHPGTHLIHTINQPIDENRSVYTEVTKTSAGDPDVVTQKENNQNGKLLSMSDFDYDQYGNVSKVTTKLDANDLSKESVQTFAYDPKYNSAFMTSQQTSGVDSAGQPFTLKMQAEYNPLTGQMNKFIDGNNAETSYQYDKLGRITKVTNPDQTTVRIDYDDENNRIIQTNETGAITETRYDPLGREEQQGIHKNGNYTAKLKYEYDSYSRIDYKEDAVGNITEYDYQPFSSGLKTITTYPDKSKFTTVEDVVNLKKSSIDGIGNKIETTMDIMGQPISTIETAIDSNDTSKQKVTQLEKLSYDYIGNVKSQEDAKHYITNFEYDYLGQLKSVTDSKLNRTTYEYDLTGNLTKQINPDGTFTEKQYDEAGRLKSNQQQGGKPETYLYDGNNNMVEHHTRTGKILKYEYDLLNRLKLRQDGTETIQYDYTSDGLRKSMTDTSGSTNYAYDPDTRELLSITYPDKKTLTYQYDERGNVTSQTGPFNDTVTFDYDSMSRIEKVNGGLDGAYSYSSNGTMKTESRGNGITAAYSYEGLKLTSLNYEHPSLSAANYSYQYDDNNNIKSFTKNDITHSFTYDELNRIKTSTLFQETYDYDARGNRSTLQSEQVPTDSNTLYEYDNWDRLKQVTNADQPKVSYKYNGDDLMIERTENGSIKRYYYDQFKNIIAEGSVQSDGSVKKVASYVRNGDFLNFRVDEQGNKQYYVLNGHGDVEYLVNSNGDILNSYTYDLWGKPISKSEKVTNPFLYSGEYWDATTDLQYLRSRWYDPSVGRFINEDTYEGELNNPLSLNLYTYVANNPLRYIDPSGHKPAGINYSEADREAIRRYQSVFAIGQKEKNLLMMQSAHDAANLIRFNYKSRLDRTSYFNDGIVYTNLSKDMYNEFLFGNVREIPLLEDPLFYVFDGTFAVAYKSLSKLAIKQMGKKSVDQTTEYLIKLDLQLFGKSIQKLDDKFIKKMGIDAHDLKYEFLGKNAKISQYDLYVDKASKEIMIFRKGGKGEGINTGYYTD